MITKTINLYTFDELSGPAKETVRDWYRGNIDSGDFEYVIDDAVRMGELLGITFDTRTVKLMGGDTRQDPKVFWSGFSSQGDGACFEGWYEYRKGAVAAVLAETSAGTPKASKGDTELLRIARELQRLQRPAFYKLTATTGTRGNPSHSGTMSVTVRKNDGTDATDDQEETLTQLLRDFADWIYYQLNQENDWLNSAERTACATFAQYVETSKAGHGRAGGEEVTWMCDGEIREQHAPGELDKVPAGLTLNIFARDLCHHFPGFLDGTDVNGGDLVDYIAQKLEEALHP